MSKEYELYIGYMLDAIAHIQEFLEGVDVAQLMADRMRYDLNSRYYSLRV